MQQVLKDILICPKTKSKIVIDAAHSIARTEQSHISYPIKAGIIDFLPDTADRISKAYDSFADAYNSYMTSCGLHWKLYCLIGWGLLDDSKILQKVLSSIPDDFDGVLLDVPVGTGLFTVDKYRKLNKAKIIAIDYSLAMLQKAKTLYTENGIRNVTFIRGDVGNVPIQQASIDLCSSMAGFHAFANKDQALHEIARVLKCTAVFSGLFYIKGKRLLTDLIVKQILCRKGFFTAPFFTEQECLSKFGAYFTVNYTANLKSCFYFEVIRNSVR